MIGWHNSAKARSVVVESQKRFEEANAHEHAPNA
jgi:hypothetical protein